MLMKMGGRVDLFSYHNLHYAYGETFIAGGLTLIVLTGARLIETVQMITRGALAGMNRPDLVLKITCVTIAVSLKLSLKYAEGIVPISVPWGDIKDESISAIVMISIILICLHFAPVDRFVTLSAYIIIGAAIYFTTLLAINGRIREKMRSLVRGAIYTFL
jgi:hypothetical protein